MPMCDAYIPMDALPTDAEREMLSRISELLIQHELRRTLDLVDDADAEASTKRARSIAWLSVLRHEAYVASAPAQEPPGSQRPRPRPGHQKGTNTMTSTPPRVLRHSMTRVDIPTGIAFDEFLAAFEDAAPVYDVAHIQQISDSGATWDDVRAAVAANAPNELMVYAKVDPGRQMAVAGHHIKAVEYLLGNHTIAETMFRHDPRALLYAPLRVLVYSDPDGNAIFTMDRPSTAFASLGIPEVTAVGESLDRKVAALLRVIGVNPGDVFDHQDDTADNPERG